MPPRAPVGSLVLFSLAAFAAACDSRSTCEVARDRLNECNEEIRKSADERGFVRLPLDVNDCEGPVDECVASCLADSNCPAITYVMLGKNGDPNATIPPGANDFAGCINRCTML